MNKFVSYMSDPIAAELYDYVPAYQNRADVEFYRNYCKKSEGRVLELGCGTGRVLIPIAEAGVEITGIDLSQHMIDRCRVKLDEKPEEVRGRVELFQGDMSDFKLDQKFARAIIPFRAFQHIVEVDDQLACLKNINRHLVVNGKLAFDVFQVDVERIHKPEFHKETVDFEEIELPDGRKLRRSFKIPLYQRSAQINSVDLIYYLTDVDGDTQRIIHKFPMRYFYRYEVEHLLARCGFKLKMIFGDFDKSPLADSSPEMIFIAEKIEEVE